MQEYEPLDLSPLCNSGPEIFGERIQAPVGPQTFHGLPFQIGPANGSGPALLGFGRETAGGAPPLRSEAMRVPIERTARRVIFAHALLDSDLMSGGPVGRVIAHYLFHYADGEVVRVPIRERFELAVVPLGWGQVPFLAVPDQKNSLAARYEGRWDAVGFRQTEARQGWPGAYYLWAWENPRPETPIAAVEIVPEGPRFIVAAITLGHVDEDPLCRAAAREVVVTLPRPEDAEKKFNLEIEVDRGVATYPYPLPADPDAGFLADDFHGWGEAPNRNSSPVYVEIAATPSATVTVKQEGEELGRVQWGTLEKEGTLELPYDGSDVAGPVGAIVEKPRVRIEVVGNGRNWVHTTVLDDETGKPVPCRIHFRSPRGIPYAPHGHHPHIFSDMGTWHIDIGGDVRLGQISYAYIDGKCQGWLPRGDVIVDVARGFEYEPLRTRVPIAPGQRELTLRLKRVAHMNRERYFSGDTHVHFLSTQGSQTEASGEDLNVVNLLQSQWGHLFTNTEEFTGRPNVSVDGQTIVYATQENRQHLLGHLTLLGLKEPVMPWCSDGPSEAELGGALEVTLSHWADACHAQGGTVVIPHLPNPNCEPATLIATGRADAVEMLVHSDYQHLEYYRYLNCGYRLPLTGGTDKMSSDVPVGIYRTYVYIPPDEEFTYDNWCKALRSGNTFLSGGPLLRFTVNGEPIGSTLRLGKDGGTVEIEASAQSILPIHSLEIVSRGKVVAATEEKNGTRSLRLRTTLRIDGNTWLAARCAGIGYRSVPHHDGWHRGIMAHTSPVYVACGGDYQLFDMAAAQYMLTLVDGGLSYIRQRSPQHRHADVTHHHGEADHMAYLERPFHEAHAAIHSRMHELGIPH